MYFVLYAARKEPKGCDRIRQHSAIAAMLKTSSFRGVTWSKRHLKWQIGISLQGRWVAASFS
jgi:hypothetical protein